jgi:hypothetical protein
MYSIRWLYWLLRMKRKEAVPTNCQHLPVYLPTHLPTYPPTYIYAYLPVIDLPAYLLTYLPVIDVV